MIKILTILGARPQFIKSSSVSREIKNHKKIKEVIIHTGQHYDANMSSIFFREMQLSKPDYFLGIGGNSHGQMTGQMIEGIEKVALKEKPDWVLVYGDTNSTLAGALAGKKLNIKVAHIEAGLRSFNMNMPEEVNRVLTDRISDVLFCPTDTAVQNLKNEGYKNLDIKIIKSGDVMQDSSLFYKKFAHKPSFVKKQKFTLCTIHRAENTKDKIRLKNIFEALEEIAKNEEVIIPLHPRTKKQLESLKLKNQNIRIVDPVGYLEMIWLIDNCNLVMTDSGGLQKEAYFFNKQCITLRDETEWIELVELGSNILVGSNKKKILNTYNAQKKSKKLKKGLNLYGNGKASIKIVKEFLK